MALALNNLQMVDMPFITETKPNLNVRLHFSYFESLIAILDFQRINFFLQL